jgi:quinoprotein glucose dehydrogenase
MPVAAQNDAPNGEWHNYGNDAGGSRFSDLTQLTPATVGKLQRVWEVHVGRPPSGGTNNLETTPLKIGGSLYLCTGYNDVLSIDAESGRINWRFHSNIDGRSRPYGTCRGVAYYKCRALMAPAPTGLSRIQSMRACSRWMLGRVSHAATLALTVRSIC